MEFLVYLPPKILFLFLEYEFMKFQLALIAVKDVERSKRFYKELFDQEVVLDFGKNVTFSGGFAIQEDFGWLIDQPTDSIKEKSNNMELYFEVDDFDEFVEKLAQYPSVDYVHPPKMHDWKQRVVRIYDPDFHIIEVGESMVVIAKRYLSQGYSVEDTAKLIQHPLAFVEKCRLNEI